MESRLVPRSRQNLGEVRRENGLTEYDSLRLLEMTEGRNSQDDCYLEPLRPGDAPTWFLAREADRVAEVVALEGFRLLVAFRSGEVRVCTASDLEQCSEGLERVLSDEMAFARVEVAAGGRGARWGSMLYIGDDVLRAAGQPIPLTWADLRRIAPALLVDAAEAARELDCTRQNINALMKRGALSAAKSSDKATLFMRSDIQARRDGSSVSYHVVRM